MTLHEIFVGEELEMEQFDLERIADLIYGWLEVSLLEIDETTPTYHQDNTLKINGIL